MSNQNEQERPYSPTRLSAYTKCPQLYDYQYDQDIDTPDTTKRYLQQGRALHGTIEEVCLEIDQDTSSEQIFDIALDEFAKAWENEVETSEFESTAHYEYYRRQAKAGIASYFDPDDGPGIEHARHSIAVERKLSATIRGIDVYGYADNILHVDGGLHILDYKRSINGMLTSGTADRLRPHLEGDEYEPKRVKNAMQTAVYIEGVKETDLYENGMSIGFSFYGLLYSTDFEAGADGYSVSARGYEREMTDIYDEHYDTIWELINQSANGIEDAQYDPHPWELIYEESCERCDYRAMCPEYITTEVRSE